MNSFLGNLKLKRRRSTREIERRSNRALGLIVPPTLIARADEVIE